MALQELIDMSLQRGRKRGLSEERVKAIIPEARRVIAIWREYPDLLVDFWVDTASEEARKKGLKLFFYQRVNEIAPVFSNEHLQM